MDRRLCAFESSTKERRRLSIGLHSRDGEQDSTDVEEECDGVSEERYHLEVWLLQL